MFLFLLMNLLKRGQTRGHVQDAILTPISLEEFFSSNLPLKLEARPFLQRENYSLIKIFAQNRV